MHATIDIDTDLIAKARAFALKEQCSFQSLVIEGLHCILDSKNLSKRTLKNSRSLQRLIVSSATGGLQKGINIDSNAAVRDCMDIS